MKAYPHGFCLPGQTVKKLSCSGGPGPTYISGHFRQAPRTSCSFQAGPTYPQTSWGPQQTWPPAVQMYVGPKVEDSICGYCPRLWAPRTSTLWAAMFVEVPGKFAGTWGLRLRYIRCMWVPMYVGPDFETSRQPETMLTPEDLPVDTLLMAAIAMVHPWNMAEDFQSFTKKNYLSITSKICIMQESGFGKVKLVLFESLSLRATHSVSQTFWSDHLLTSQ
jgi:hypothetical protein